METKSHAARKKKIFVSLVLFVIDASFYDRMAPLELAIAKTKDSTETLSSGVPRKR